MPDAASFSVGMTLVYLRPLVSQSCANLGHFSARRFQRMSERQMGVAPPVSAACSQKKKRRLGEKGVCAISGWRQVGTLGGGSLAVKKGGVFVARAGLGGGP